MWLPLDGGTATSAQPVGENMPLAPSSALSGRVIALVHPVQLQDQEAVQSILTFDQSCQVMQQDPSAPSSQTFVPCHVFEVRPGVFLIGFQPELDPDRDTAIVWDEAGGRAIEINALAIGGISRSLEVTVNHLAIDPLPFAAGETRPPLLSRSPFVLTDELVGKRVLYRYGASHVYEHIYLTSDLFVWHDIGGHRADTESVLMYRVQEDLYLVHWTERAEARAATMVLDLAELRIIGCLFGWQPAVGNNSHITVGATARVLNATSSGGRTSSRRRH